VHALLSETASNEKELDFILVFLFLHPSFLIPMLFLIHPLSPLLVTGLSHLSPLLFSPGSVLRPSPPGYTGRENIRHHQDW
jgi:hypothetical protein